MRLDLPLMDNNITREDLDQVIGFLGAKEMPILTQSRQVQALEAEWSQWLGVKHSVFVNSGSSANFMTMSILRELAGPGEVIVPPLTWVSDIAAVLAAGFTPVFADINPRTLAMDADAILACLTPATRAVFLTHILGFDGLTDRLLDGLKARGIPLIEDVCESHGATHGGRKLGTFGLVSNFSFYYAHHMSTVEGGMVCTDDERVYQMARSFRSHGMVREATDGAVREAWARNWPDLNPDFIFAYPGHNFRNSEMNAVIGRSQLPRLDRNNLQRRENFRLFMENLDGKRYFTDFKVEGSCNYAFTLVLREPDTAFCNALMAALRAAGVEFRRGASGGGNQLRQPYLKHLVPEGHHLRFPQAEHIHFYGFYLGNYPSLKADKILALCRLLNEVA